MQRRFPPFEPAKGGAASLVVVSAKEWAAPDTVKEEYMAMFRRVLFMAVVFALAWQPASARNKRPRYVFIFPEGYVGWIQVIFNDPAASRLPTKDNGHIIDVPESGITRTSELRVHDFKRLDEFYYRCLPATGEEELQKVPTEYVLPGDSHGGFGVMDTGGKGKGYSWFVFVGPPSIRSTVPLADWDKEVEVWRKLHGNPRVPAPDPYPNPGRMSAVAGERGAASLGGSVGEEASRLALQLPTQAKSRLDWATHGESVRRPFFPK
jgi:hypothetical protein